LPEWSFNTENITIVRNSFLFAYNYKWKLTSLPEWSFNTSNIKIAGENFLGKFNEWWKITKLPEWSLDTSNTKTIECNYYVRHSQNSCVETCKNKCEKIEWYWEREFIQRYNEKYWKKPQKNCYKSMNGDNVRKCYSYKYPEDFSYNYSWYEEWIKDIFPFDIQKIQEYNNCIQICWPMMDIPALPQ